MTSPTPKVGGRADIHGARHGLRAAGVLRDEFTFANVGDRDEGRVAGTAASENAETTGRRATITIIGGRGTTAVTRRDSRRDGTLFKLRRSPSAQGDGLAFPGHPSGRRHLFKDPGTNAVFSLMSSGRQPSRAPTHGLFITKGCVDRALNFFVSRPKPGSYPTDDGTKFLHAQQLGENHGREVVKVSRE